MDSLVRTSMFRFRMFTNSSCTRTKIKKYSTGTAETIIYLAKKDKHHRSALQAAFEQHHIYSSNNYNIAVFTWYTIQYSKLC